MATLNENIARNIAALDDIKTSLEGKGITVGNVPVEQYSTLIDSITTGETNELVTIFQKEPFKQWFQTFVEDLNITRVLVPDSPTIDINDIRTIISQPSYRAIRLLPQIIIPANTTNVAYIMREFHSLLYIDVDIQGTDVNLSLGDFIIVCNSLRDININSLHRVVNMESAFSDSSNIRRIHNLNAPNCTTFKNCLKNLNNTLESIKDWNLSSVSTADGVMFAQYSLDFSKFTTLNMVGDIKTDCLDNGFEKFTALTRESLLSILNALYDYTGGTTHTLKLGAKNLAKLTTEDKLIATNKNWTLIT